MITAAEAIDQVHSRRVLHYDIREENILILNNPQDPFPIRFIDFGHSRPTEGDSEELIADDFRTETENWMALLIGYYGLEPKESFPALRAIPREGAIVKFIKTWNIRATYEEQVEAIVAKRMARGPCSEAALKRIISVYVR